MGKVSKKVLEVADLILACGIVQIEDGIYKVSHHEDNTGEIIEGCVDLFEANSWESPTFKLTPAELKNACVTDDDITVTTKHDGMLTMVPLAPVPICMVSV